MVADLDPLGPVPCTIKGCYLSFKTLKEMKRHKDDEPDHFYCKRCDVDCIDWEDLTKHKVEAMMPWLEGRSRFGTNPAHICCEFCGEDFRTMTGRNKHREQMHPADQNIICPGGCGSRFTRAAGLMQHLESGRCPFISSSHFYACIQKKQYFRQIFRDVTEDMSFLIKDEETPCNLIGGKPGQIISGNDLTVSTEYPDRHGKHMKLSQSNSGKERVTVASKCEDDLISLGEEGGVCIHEEGREFPAWQTGLMTEGMSTVSLRDDANNDGRPQTPNRGSTATATSDPGKLDMGWPSINPVISGGSAESMASKQQVESQKPWTSNATAQKLFPFQKATGCLAASKQSTHNAIELQRTWQPSNELTTLDSSQLHKKELLKKLYEAQDVDGEEFRHHTTGRYECPFPTCSAEMVSFEAYSDLEVHIFCGHARRDYSCSACLKRFDKPSKLVAHCESNTRCPIQKSKNFRKLIDEITGGYLISRTLQQAKICYPDSAAPHALITQDERPVTGVMRAEFKAAIPDHTAWGSSSTIDHS